MKIRTMLRRAAAFGLAAALSMSLCLTAHAEEITRSGWTADFTGDAIQSNFNSYDWYSALCELLPGDSAMLRVDVKNTSSEYVQWYMSNATLQTLEDTRAAARDGGYSYKLTYTSNSTAGNVPNNGSDVTIDGGTKTDTNTTASGGTGYGTVQSGTSGTSNVQASSNSIVLFDSDTVSGDGGAGLYEATDGLDEFFKMCTMAPGGSGYVMLYVKLDGETQGNNYQNTLARLRLNFAVNIIPANYVEVPGDPTKVTIQDPPTRIEIPGDPTYVIPDGNPPLSDIPQYTTVPQTGDTITLAIWSSLAMICGIGGIVAFILWRRKDKEGNQA